MEAQALTAAGERMGDAMNEAVELVANLKGKLVVTGVGKSGLVGGKMAATFASTGTPSFFLHPTEAMHGDLGMIGPGDGVLAISNSGESEELVRILPHLKRFDIPLIGMSAKAGSTLGRYSDVFLDIAVEKEACPLNVAPTSSTTLTMAVGDALAVCLMKKRQFTHNDFASFHPGGSLGKRLFVKALDLARKENLPVIDAASTVKEAIAAITEGKLGTVLFTENGNLKALLTDGDLRRALMDPEFSLEKNALEYATVNPKTFSGEHLLASDALELIEDNKIQLLVLTGNDGKLLGLLHIHDLVEAGIR